MQPILPSLVFGSLLGAVTGIFIVMQLEPILSMPNEFADYPIQPSTEYMVRYHAALRFMYSNNYAIYFAILGLGIGLSTGVSVGRKHRLIAMIVCGFYGCVFGTLAGFVSGLGVAFTLQNSGNAIPFLGMQIEPIVQSTFMQCFAWTLVSIGVAWGFSVSTGRTIAKGIQMGIIGGCFIGVGYTLIEAICFPSANGFLIVPISMFEKITWVSFAGLTLGATIFYASNQEARS